MPWAQIPAFMAELRTREANAVEAAYRRGDLFDRDRDEARRAGISRRHLRLVAVALDPATAPWSNPQVVAATKTALANAAAGFPQAYWRRRLLANAAIAASRVGSCSRIRCG